MQLPKFIGKTNEGLAELTPIESFDYTIGRKWIVCSYGIIDIDEIIAIHIREEKEYYGVYIRTANSLILAEKGESKEIAVRIMKELFDKIRQKGDIIIDKDFLKEE